MTDLEELIQDLRAHAPEAPAQCAALMRRAAAELDKRKFASVADVAARLASRPAQSFTDRDPGARRRVKGEPCS